MPPLRRRERLDFLADNPHFTKRFAFYVGRRCRQASIRDVAQELKLDWETVKTLEMQYMRAQLKRAGTPGPRAIGIDEISVRKGHSYRIVVSDRFASGRSGSAARIVPRPAWRRSTIGWARKEP
jgi:transposase